MDSLTIHPVVESFLPPSRENTIAAALLFLAVVYVIYRIYRARKQRRYYRAIESLAHQIALHIRANFLVQPCTRCHENLMSLVQVSPNARSVKCKCDNCGKWYWAAASNRDALALKDFVADLEDLKERYRYFAKPGTTMDVKIEFTTPESLLPFEQTTREPIPESTRAEVWRRDGGKCVVCKSRHNIEFDHIIPVSKGGSTSAKNLQLLCKACNLKKHQKI